ncbi:MAG: DUF2789 family protein [Gammaproteobacteria bacterium]
MELNDPDLCELFAQLGLDNSPAAVESFIADHCPIPQGISLHKAEFWTPVQAEFLCQAIADDAEWAVVVERLDSRLRKPYSLPHS